MVCYSVLYSLSKSVYVRTQLTYLLQEYVGNVSAIKAENLQQITNMFTDSFFSYGISKFLDYYLPKVKLTLAKIFPKSDFPGQEQHVPVHLQLQGAQPGQPQLRAAAALGRLQGQAADRQQRGEEGFQTVDHYVDKLHEIREPDASTGV